MSVYLRSFLMPYRDPAMRKYVARPLALAVLLYLALLALGFALVVPFMGGVAERFGLAPGLGAAGGAVAWGVLWFFVSGPVFITFANLTAAWFWEGLSRAVERELYGIDANVKVPLVRAVVDTAVRVPLTLVAALTIVVFGWACFGAVAVLVAGSLALLDFTSPAFARRGVLFPRQVGRAWRCPGALPLAVLAGLGSLLPLVNVLLLPGWVAMGTAVCGEAKGNQPQLYR